MDCAILIVFGTFGVIDAVEVFREPSRDTVREGKIEAEAKRVRELEARIRDSEAAIRRIRKSREERLARMQELQTSTLDQAERPRWPNASYIGFIFVVYTLFATFLGFTAFAMMTAYTFPVYALLFGFGAFSTWAIASLWRARGHNMTAKLLNRYSVGIKRGHLSTR